MSRGDLGGVRGPFSLPGALGCLVEAGRPGVTEWWEGVSFGWVMVPKGFGEVSTPNFLLSPGLGSWSFPSLISATTRVAAS